MAYTVTWDSAYESAPDGDLVDADTLDTLLQEFKVAIRERMNTILDPAHQWDQDPIALPAATGAAASGLTVVFGPHVLIAQDDEDDIFRAEYVQSDISGKSMYGSITMPVGVMITLFEAWVDKNSSSGANIDFGSVDPATGTYTSITGTLTRTSAGIGVLSSAALTHTVTNAETLLLHMFPGGASGRCRAYGFRLTYNRTDLTQVL